VCHSILPASLYHWCMQSIPRCSKCSSPFVCESNSGMCRGVQLNPHPPPATLFHPCQCPSITFHSPYAFPTLRDRRFPVAACSLQCCNARVRILTKGKGLYQLLVSMEDGRVTAMPNSGCLCNYSSLCGAQQAESTAVKQCSDSVDVLFKFILEESYSVRRSRAISVGLTTAEISGFHSLQEQRPAPLWGPPSGYRGCFHGDRAAGA
jgi:hypothetical protein